jgi:hypothetical protein
MTIDIPRAEVIAGFAIRAGQWIDAIQIITSAQDARASPLYGNPNGGTL